MICTAQRDIWTGRIRERREGDRQMQRGLELEMQKNSRKYSGREKRGVTLGKDRWRCRGGSQEI